jgi:hypothetical protein
MDPLVRTGVALVVAALASYTVAVIAERRGGRVSPWVLLFLTVGVMFDITATLFMALASSRGPFSLHGLIGTTSLAGMMVAAVLMWRVARRGPMDAPVPRGLHLYVLVAYLWWVAAFVTGALLGVMR